MYSTGKIRSPGGTGTQLEPLHPAVSTAGFLSIRHYAPFWAPVILSSLTRWAVTSHCEPKPLLPEKCFFIMPEKR